METITRPKDLIGKTISGVYDCGGFYMAFTDGSYTKFCPDYDGYYVELDDRAQSIDDLTRYRLNLITQQEYENRCKRKKLEADIAEEEAAYAQYEKLRKRFES